MTEFNLVGKFVPFYPLTHRPIFLESSGGLLLPIFTTKEKYEEGIKVFNISSARCNEIVKKDDFINAALQCKKRFEFMVVVDPFITLEGNTRFQLLNLENEAGT